MPKEVTVNIKIDKTEIERLIRSLEDMTVSVGRTGSSPMFEAISAPRREGQWIRSSYHVGNENAREEFLGLEALVGNDARRRDRQLAAANEMERLRIKRRYGSRPAWLDELGTWPGKTPCLTE